MPVNDVDIGNLNIADNANGDDVFTVVGRCHSNLTSRYVDIVGEFAGQELFLIEFDSIVRHVYDRCLLHDPNPYGVQVLTFIYAFERLAWELERRGCVFEFISFSQFRPISGLDSSNESAISRSYFRDCLEQHIVRQLHGKIKLSHVESPFTSDWVQLLDDRRPAFVLTSDGSSFNDDESSNEVKAVLRSFMFQLSELKCPIGLLENLDIRSFHPKLFVVMPFFVAQMSDQAFMRNLTQSSKKLLEKLQTDLSKSQGQKVSDVSFDPKLAIGPRAVAFQACLLAVTSASGEWRRFAKIFIKHLELLPSLSITQRRQWNIVDRNSDGFAKVYKFLTDVIAIASQITSSHLDKVADSDLFDPFDLNVFITLLKYTELNKSQVTLASENIDIPSEFMSVWNEIIGSAPVELRFGEVEEGDGLLNKDKSRGNTFAFSSALLDKVLSNELLDSNEDLDSVASSPTLLGADEDPFQSAFDRDRQSYWAVGPLSVETKKQRFQQLTDVQKAKNARNEQFYVASTQRYAESLTGAGGAPLPQKLITIKKRQSKSSGKDSSELNEKKQSKSNGKPKQLSKKEQIIAAQAESKSQKVREKNEKSLENFRASAASLKGLDKKLQYFDATYSRIGDNKDVSVGVLLLKLQELLGSWSKHCRVTEREDILDEAWQVVEIYKITQELYYQQSQISPAVHKKVSEVLKLIGIDTIIPKKPSLDASNPLVSLDVSPLQKVNCAIPCRPELFQLQYCGPYMERSVDSRPDSRVHFDPDAWQRDVLDILDAGESVVVTAPTSAGKTFIGYYAMELVLTEDDDGVLVYVAPTKALVNQIAAEIYARFRKVYQTPGRSVYCILTNDYRINDPKNCQILVTVPNMLQSLFLSPEYSKKWVPRIKRIIFDEIHSLGQPDGQIWEQSILMTAAPITALSATIGNAQQFYQWMKVVQNVHQIKTHLVTYQHRYSHLRQFGYSPAARQTTFKGLPKSKVGGEIDDVDDFVFLHPYGALKESLDEISSDLSLESNDCCTVLHAMQVALMKAKGVDEENRRVKNLSPAIYFKNTPYIRNVDVQKYEKDLRNVLQDWLKDPKYSTTLFRSALSEIDDDSRPSLAKRMRMMEKNLGIDESQFMRRNMIAMLSKLHEMNELPALIFSFSREVVEEQAKGTLEDLIAAENVFRETDPAWVQKMKQWQVWRKNAKEREKQKARAARNVKDADERLIQQMESGDESSWQSSFDPDEPISNYSFAGIAAYPKEDLKYELDRLRRRRNPIPEWTIQCLERGIGVHHASMNRRYRQLVEVLFRRGHLRVVFSTNTLALGINMPCKTVIFGGNSEQLSPLSYRQCAGRAGRRGFDLLGKVIFYGLPVVAIDKLVSSKIPALTGHSTVTPTLVLRLFGLLSGGGNPLYARKAISGILNGKGLNSTGDMEKKILFCMEFLKRNDMILDDGRLTGLAGLAAHLYEYEPANFGLVALLESGLFHRICEDYNSATEHAIHMEILTILAHLFCRRIHRRTNIDNLDALRQETNSRVLLDPMPTEVREVLESFNASTLNFLHDSLPEIRESSNLESDALYYSTLPTLQQPQVEDKGLIDRLAMSAVPAVCKSPFVRPGNRSEKFSSLPEFEDSVDSSFGFETSMLPIVDIDSKSLDAYIIDFWTHGSLKTLTDVNLIPATEVWFTIQDFYTVLAAIVKSLNAACYGKAVDVAWEHGDPDGEATVFDEEDEATLTEENLSDGTLRVGKSSLRVLKAFVSLRNKFDEKFKKTFA